MVHCILFSQFVATVEDTIFLFYPCYSLECLQWLILHADGDPYIVAKDGMSSIHVAAQAGQLPCLKWLVEKASVPVRLRATDGATPAHFAAANGEVCGSLSFSFSLSPPSCLSNPTPMHS